MRAFLIGIVLFVDQFTLRADRVVYSDALKEYYPIEGETYDLGSYALEVPVVAWDERRSRSATVVRTRGDAYPYERQKGVITIEGEGIEEPVELSVSRFRTINVSWISEKLIQIKIGVSRTAVVEAIYDILNREWVYLESLQYVE